MKERTLVLIKPDGVKRGFVGHIIERFEKSGMKIVGMKQKWVDKEFSKKHYEAHIEKDFYPGLEEYITEGPVVAIVLEGLHVVETVRKMVGPTEPKTAAPGTIRGDLAHGSFAYSDTKGTSVRNLIHASGTVEEANMEIGLWFTDEELHSYATVHEKEVQ